MKENLFARIRKKIPIYPISALLFYLFIFFLWKYEIIPTPKNVLVFLENLYQKYGFIGLFLASFLEGVVYLGLYFPGSFIIALVVIFSDGKLCTLLQISITVSVSLTVTSVINYYIGKLSSVLRKSGIKNDIYRKFLSKNFFFSMLHPTVLAFYFFSIGKKRYGIKNIILVPVVMLPYGLFVGILLFQLKGLFRRTVENPYAMFIALLVWIIISFIYMIVKNGKEKRDNKIPVE